MAISKEYKKTNTETFFVLCDLFKKKIFEKHLEKEKTSVGQ